MPVFILAYAPVITAFVAGLLESYALYGGGYNEAKAAEIDNSALQKAASLTRLEAANIQLATSAALGDQRGMTQDQIQQMMENELRSLNLTQAEAGSIRMEIAKLSPILTPLSTVAGTLGLAKASVGFATALNKALAEGIRGMPAMARAFVGMGKLGYISAGLMALGYVVPQALNVAHDYTAMQPTMKVGALANLLAMMRKDDKIGITSFGDFSAADLDTLLQAYLDAGYTGYSDPYNMISTMLTRGALSSTLEKIIGAFNAQGTAPTRADVVAQLHYAIFSSRAANNTKPIPLITAKQATAGAAGTTSSYVRQPVTRIYMAKTAKPQLLLGTLITHSVKDPATFTRVRDDKITDKADLMSDAQSNLNAWLATLPGRLVYNIAIKQDPFDENGVKQVGVWAVLELLVRGLNGRTTFLDTIPLGPLDPTQYMPKAQEVQTISVELPKLLTAEEISQVQFPSGDLRMIDKQGNSVPLSFQESRPAGGEGGAQVLYTEPKPVAPPAAATTPAVAPAATPAPSLSAAPAPAATPAVVAKVWPETIPTSGNPYTIIAPAPFNATLTLAAGRALSHYGAYPAGIINDSGLLRPVNDVRLAPGGFQYLSAELYNFVASGALPAPVSAAPAPQPAAPAAPAPVTVPAGWIRINAEDEAPQGSSVQRFNGLLYYKPSASFVWQHTTYGELVNRGGTIYHRASGHGYPSPTDLAAALGIRPDQIQWNLIATS